MLRALAEARALGFLGPGPLESHVHSAQRFAEVLADRGGGPGLDLGSGGGVPGLLLAAWFPDMDWVLLDLHRRRTSFLARVVAELGWAGRVAVVHRPAEEAAHDPDWREAFAIVTSRSFGPPAVTAECASGFLAVGGLLVVAEPPLPDVERWPVAPLGTLSLRRVPSGASVAVLEKTGRVADEVPRVWRELQRRPRW